ncbi:unnamed protein product [Owenia fusiformis]|uniref:Uncharacterized protein n=1 Tax=Owenia fusiformis TaxID=6347 RepID=A0A8S4NXB8_OWEFU|nr:unnamed protein product [Owenia fusiformis]
MVRNIRRITFVAYFLWLHIHNIATWEDTGDCYHGNFVLVKQAMQIATSCPETHTPLWGLNVENCLKSACAFITNLVIYKHYLHGHSSCSMYNCESNENDTDWEYGWRHWWEFKQTSAYVLPHHSTPRCHDSYFIRRSWDTRRNVNSICSNVTHLAVNNVSSCMSFACEVKANVLDYVKDNHTCRVMHCNWNFKPWQNNFYFTNKIVTQKVATYSLLSLSNISKEAYTHNKNNEQCETRFDNRKCSRNLVNDSF